MTPYFILLFLVVILLQFKKSKQNNGYKFIYWLVAFILILFATVRSSAVGTDTNNYVGSFTSSLYRVKNIFTSEGSLEIGYLALEKLALQISHEYWALLFTIACICVLPVFFTIRKLSRQFLLSIFLYISLGTYLFFFNGARQAIAASIISISIIFIINKNIFKYVLVVVIASLFHRSALIMLPFYFILNFTFSYFRILIYAALGFIAMYYYTTLIGVFDEKLEDRYIEYENRGATGGYLLAIFYVLISMFLVVIRSKVEKYYLNEYDVYLNMCVSASLVYLVVVVTGSDVNFLRVSLYFSMGHILIWPIVFKYTNFFKIPFTKFIFFMGHLMFFYIYLDKMSDFTPFKFNIELFSNIS